MRGGGTNFFHYFFYLGVDFIATDGQIKTLERGGKGVYAY